MKARMRSADLVEVVDLESKIHAARGTELIDENLRSGMTLDVLEKQGRAAGSSGELAFTYPVGDFGDFEDRIHLGANGL